MRDRPKSTGHRHRCYESNLINDIEVFAKRLNSSHDQVHNPRNISGILNMVYESELRMRSCSVMINKQQILISLKIL